MNKEIERLNKENKNLKEDFKRHIDRINELTNRIDKAIEYIEQKKLQPRLRTANVYSLQERQLLDILKGSDIE